MMDFAGYASIHDMHTCRPQAATTTGVAAALAGEERVAMGTICGNHTKFAYSTRAMDRVVERTKSHYRLHGREGVCNLSISWDTWNLLCWLSTSHGVFFDKVLDDSLV